MVTLGKTLWQLLALGLAMIAFVGCGGSTPAAVPEPLGAAAGKNTFILFYTDN